MSSHSAPPSIWRHLGKARLQQIVGDDLLARLERFLPAIDPDFTPLQLFSAEGLSAVVDAFYGVERLHDRRFRDEVLNSLPAGLIDQVLAECDPSTVAGGWQQRLLAVHRLWSNPQTRQSVARSLGLPSQGIESEGAPYPPISMLPACPTPYKPLKDYQSSVFLRAVAKLTNPRSRFVVQMPTGSGKTRTAMEIIATILNDHPDGTLVVWLAHSEELCEQAYDCFLEVWAHVATRRVNVARCWGDSFLLPDCSSASAFLVAGFQKLFSQLDRQADFLTRLANSTSVIVVDEAHKAIAPTYAAAIRSLIGPSTCVVGLTATPGRSVVDTSENEALAAFFFNDIVGIECGSQSPINYLRTRGILAALHYTPLVSGRSYELTAAEESHLTDFNDLSATTLSRIASDDLRNIEILRRLCEEIDAGGRILFFGCSVEHSKFICALLTYRGVAAAHLDGATNKARRRALIADFRAGRVQVLCNYALLSTGFDAPKVDVVFIARPTQSLVLYSQMIGRGLRGPAIGGTQACRVVDVIDNIIGFSNENRVYNYFADYFTASRP
jgi:DNA repair protein RadD